MVAVMRVQIRQEGDSLMDTLEPYLQTGVNLTTFRFRYGGTGDGAAADLTPTAGNGRYDDDVFATVYDSLLTLYQGVRHQSRAGGKCHWAGSNLLPTLTKVSVSFIALPLSAIVHLSTFIHQTSGSKEKKNTHTYKYGEKQQNMSQSYIAQLRFALLC